MAEASTVDATQNGDSLRQRAVAIQIIGASTVDRSARRQRRLGASLLLALYLGWNSLMQAMSGPVPFPSAMGRFLFVFLATVISIGVLGNLYDDYAERVVSGNRSGRFDRSDVVGEASPSTANQPASGGEEGLGSDR